MTGDLVTLAERLISYDTSQVDGVMEAAGFVEGWLDSSGVAVEVDETRGLPVLRAEVGEAGAPIVVLHGHLDVVPADPGQFEPRIDGDRLYGRGAYDMKAALAAMMHVAVAMQGASGVRVRLGIVCDEESEAQDERGSDGLVDAGFVGEFAITGEPTDLDVGIEAKGVLALRLLVSGTAAHGATPWLGNNAALRAYETFRSIEALPFAGQSSELFAHPSVNLARIVGGDALNKVPDRCAIDVDIRYLPGQDPEEILAAVEALPGVTVRTLLLRPSAHVDPGSPYVDALLAAATADGRQSAPVGRDGISDAVSFLRVGVPAVEFGPVGDGHHGPEEWVSVTSLLAYRQALETFLRSVPKLTRD